MGGGTKVSKNEYRASMAMSLFASHQTHVLCNLASV